MFRMYLSMFKSVNPFTIEYVTLTEHTYAEYKGKSTSTQIPLERIKLDNSYTVNRIFSIVSKRDQNSLSGKIL